MTPPSFDVQPYLTQLGLAVTFVAGVIVAILKLNKQASKNTKEIDEDKASSNILSVALRQRDEALKAAEQAWGQRIADAQLIASFKTEKEFHETEKKAYAKEFMQMEALCRRAARELQAIDPERAALLFPSGWMELGE